MIKYIIGDVCEPVCSDGKQIIAHCCNNEGKMGSGVALAISKKYPAVKLAYCMWAEEEKKKNNKLPLGEVQFVGNGPGKNEDCDIIIANIIGQDGIGFKKGVAPVRYEAIREGLEEVRDYAKKLSATVHLPRMASGLAGGSWGRVEKIINEVFGDTVVYVYDFVNTDAEEFVSWNK